MKNLKKTILVVDGNPAQTRATPKLLETLCHLRVIDKSHMCNNERRLSSEKWIDCKEVNLKKTILLVEDSLVQRLALLKLFKPYNVNVLWAENGKDGLVLARQLLPAVILLDVHMPGGMDGLEVCRLLRDDTHTASIPIILFTSHNDLETLRDGYGNGAVEFIAKDGFHEAVLLETLFHLHVIDRSAAPER